MAGGGIRLPSDVYLIEVDGIAPSASDGSWSSTSQDSPGRRFGFDKI